MKTFRIEKKEDLVGKYIIVREPGISLSSVIYISSSKEEAASKFEEMASKFGADGHGRKMGCLILYHLSEKFDLPTEEEFKKGVYRLQTDSYEAYLATETCTYILYIPVEYAEVEKLVMTKADIQLDL